MFIESFLLLLALNFLSAGRVNRPEERIIGGHPIEIEVVPWMVSIQVNGLHVNGLILKGHHFCGGSIYNADTIITAAHCFFYNGTRIDDGYFEIRAGSVSKKSNGTLVKVAAVKVHEYYVHKESPVFDVRNDIAVVRLSERLEFTNKVQPIPLAESNPEPGTMSFATGWGCIFESEDLGISPINLLGVMLRIQTPNSCSISHGQSTICAGYSKQTACEGDSGGPLVINRQLVGVTSAGGVFCDRPATFSSVPFYREWILNAVKSFPQHV
ncbi:trypsin alpha-like [Drosophila teissieri]|uniref:trypsin alpha-like n=1 Tax=Drosophila teissieri TaxID=7243 RepID=UPI001CBA4385|nr:trypsin alpha-like [Drosophila teissieri]